MKSHGRIIAAFLLAAAFAASCPGAAAQSIKDPSWPAVRGPFSWADKVMNTTTIARSGGIYELRLKTKEIFTPAFSVVSYSAEGLQPVRLNTEFFSYALGSHNYQDAANLLFADGLFQPSDTLDYLQGVVSYDIHDFALAAECFSRIPESSPYYGNASEFLDVWTSTPVTDYKARSPFLAATMSAVIPGAGKIYAGDLRSGVSTFLIVGALGGMVAESWSKYGIQDWRTITLSSIFGLFYIGNIYGSAISVSVIKDTYEQAQKATLLFNLHVPLHQF